ncbi:MAG: VOC family protein [Sphingomonadales bacterium]|nr:MAG: VOC family protein [Sphingomonadales bacterium]
MHIAKLALVVRDYDEAIDWYTRCLGFALVENVDMGNGKRWVVVAPTGARGAALLLAKAANAQQEAAIGNQSGGRVFLFLETDSFDRDHARMVSEGVHFREAPRSEAYGKVAVFEDLHGNAWDLIGPA